MNSLHTTSVSLAVGPTAVSTLFSHYINKKILKESPTDHLSYDEGLHLIKSFLEYASQHTVEELQNFTGQWVPHPHWVKLENEVVPDEHLARAAGIIHDALGEDGLRAVGGRRWWQWRGPKPALEAEWIEMRSDFHERRKSGDPPQRVMLYVHGGAFYFGSVDEHRYQMQRHARKLKARVFAPRYRLSPQFPFPCGLHDCLAAYLYLLTIQDPSTIVLAGDSAGGGMVLALLCLIRDHDIPLPAGGILISPWADLTHSFPSVAGDAPLDYIPSSGFHHKPSLAWPPPNDDDFAMIRAEVAKSKKSQGRGQPRKIPSIADMERRLHGPIAHADAGEPGSDVTSGGMHSSTSKFLTVMVDGELITMKDQIQLYTTNSLLSHPLVSTVMQPTLGGLPPLLILVGGGEILRDEQIYLAHKCANPQKYAPAPENLTERGRMLLAKYKPTDVQLQVWDDLCHVAPTLSFTRPAKYMYRSIAQFGAWALARAQMRGIEIVTSSDASDSTPSGSDPELARGWRTYADDEESVLGGDAHVPQVGKAGDPLPPFQNHMIRQRVTRLGHILPLPLEADLPGCCMEASEIGVIKEGPVRKWLETRRRNERKWASVKAKVHKKLIKEMVAGYREPGPGEQPPPSALAGRIPLRTELPEEKKRKGLGLALWSHWGSKHDKTVLREQEAMREPEFETTARGFTPGGPEALVFSPPALLSRRKTVTDENQTGEEGLRDENDTPVAQLIAMRRDREAPHADDPDHAPETGVAGKRPFLDGIALPFSLRNEAASSSMVTLHSDASSANESRPASASSFKMGLMMTPTFPVEDELDDEEASRARKIQVPVGSALHQL
ncbi:AB hydrolase superfamily protein [Escovopsis weberi]|uniref:AB hydrolase superfamily protein n=1 Tax=Escovopsis weberi TaxID=150374 RepID=A0A0M8MS37_ESCWE|nr:AB hydrolase superfamily protein [Escovopsis weberi]